jgi:hypothetical protein
MKKKTLHYDFNVSTKKYKTLLKGNKLLPSVNKKLKQVKKEIKQHFKKDGWPLNYEYYKDEVISHIIGDTLLTYISLSIFTDKNYHVQFKNGETLLIKNKKK